MSTTLIQLKGFNGKTVYYDPKMKHLYSQYCGYKKASYLMCYEDAKQKKKKGKSSNPCGGRRRLDGNGNSWSTHEHANHKNHEITYRDLVSLNAMKERCRFLSQNYPGHAHKVSTKIIYLTEIAKYVYILPTELPFF